MFSKSNLIATLVAAIVLFILGWVFYGMLTEGFFEDHAGSATGIMKEEPNLLLIAIGNLIQAFFLATIYSKWARGIHSVKEGFSFGALVGAFMGIGGGLIWYAVSNMGDATSFAVDGIWQIIQFGIAGAVIAIIYKSTAAK